MPLSVFERAADGSIDFANQKMRNLGLEREISSDDFGVGISEFKRYGFRHAWLHANFDEHVLHVPESAEFDAEKETLAKFLNENMSGPYFVHQGFENTRWTLSIVILKEEDRKKFQANYPKWKVKEDAPQRNSETLEKWKQGERDIDPQLFDYIS